ncbi:MAG TPA: O-antigen ligase family protein [Malonomonas sp.]
MKIDEQKFGIGLVLLCIIMTPFGRGGEIPLILMALLGAWKFFPQRKELLSLQSIRDYSLLFVVLWLPMLIASFDAVNLGKSVATALQFVRFYFVGIYIILLVKDRATRDLIIKYSSYILLFWIFDALVQAGFGRDLFGYEILPGRLNGIFGRHYKLGLFLGVYAPLLCTYLYLTKNKLKQLVGFTALVLVMLLAGSRAGWIMFAVGFIGFIYLLHQQHKIIRWRQIAVLIPLLLVVLFGSYQLSPAFAQKVKTSMLIFSGDVRLIDKAVSKRVPIWTTAWHMFQDNPVNGVGPRSFRYAYNDYAAEDDPWNNSNNDGTGAMHGHSMLVDIACETGSIGLVSLAIVYLLLIRAWLRAKREARFFASPFALCLLAALFPINTHFAFYSGAWLQVLFWLMALFLATLHVQAEDSHLLSASTTA